MDGFIAWINGVLSDKVWVIVIMSILIVALTELIKILPKKLTKKVCGKNVSAKYVVNIVLITAIMFGLAVLLNWLYNHFYLKVDEIDFAFVGSVFCTAETSYAIIFDMFKKIFAKVKTDTADGSISLDEIKSTASLTKDELQKLRETINGGNKDESKKV